MIDNRHPFPLKPFYFIRHGETEWNKRNIIMGSQDIPLNEVGLQQAHEASFVLENKNFDVIVSSPRIRAKQTAEIISKKTNTTLMFEEGLAEINWGAAEGTPHDPTKSIFNMEDTPQGAETFAAFQKRVIEAMSGVLLMDKLPLIVSHGGVFKALTHHLGYQDLSSSNCVPFFFNPPGESFHLWLICSLSKDTIGDE